jgi:hypothetical protein
MKKMMFCLVLFSVSVAWVMGQSSEKLFPLAKEVKGKELGPSQINEKGNFELMFLYSQKKKSFSYSYEIDKNLNLVGQKTDEIQAEPLDADYKKEVSYLSSHVGGKTSFDVLSHTIKVNKYTAVRYAVKSGKKIKYKNKIITNDEMKISSVEGDKYKGCASYTNYTDGSLFILAYTGSQDDPEFTALNIDLDLKLKEIPIPLKKHSRLVYTCLVNEATGRTDIDDLGEGKAVFIFASTEKDLSVNEYTFVMFDSEGAILQNFKFNSPAIELVIAGICANQEGTFIFGLSDSKSKRYTLPPYNSISYYSGEQIGMEQYYKKVTGQDYEQLYVLKLSSDKMVYSKAYDLKAISEKARISGTNKKAVKYKGKYFGVDAMDLYNDKLVVCVQEREFSLMNKWSMFKFRNAYAFVFNQATGDILGDFGIETLTQKDLGIIYEAPMNLNLSKDGKSVYWTVLENKSKKVNVASPLAAMSGRTEYILVPRFYPGIAKIDLENLTMSSFTYLGGGKFLMKDFKVFEVDNTAFYLALDEKNKNIWIAKYLFE